MARAYAETVWLPAQPAEKQASAGQLINDVFGWASDATAEASAGQIVFFDAWPEQWTPLVADILNNHHPSYYQNQEPPGDWDSPVPVYFLAVPAGHTFRFAVAKRRADVSEELLTLAMQWLVGALEYEGAGAKTASGYGAFKVTTAPEQLSTEQVQKTWQTAVEKKRREEFSCELELVTPAFLAGPNQGEEDCDLRPATLRGMLRWWWRTMHAGHVDAKTLSRLEAAVWGDTNSCGAVRVTVEPITGIQRLLYDKEQIKRKNSLPEPSNTRTTPGLYYFTFGMDDFRREGSQRVRYRRYYLVPGAKWRVRVTVRPGIYEVKNAKGEVVRAAHLDDPSTMLSQAQAALWLLCNFGGVGSKSRKGFGCFKVPQRLLDWNLERCKTLAEEFRRVCGVSKDKGGLSPTLESMIVIDDIPAVKNVWWVLDRIGTVVQAFAQRYTKNPQKKALGLPRNVRGHFVVGPNVAKTNRHASPIIFHVSQQESGYVVRCVAFPSPELPLDPTRQSSKQFLSKALEFVGAELRKQFKNLATSSDANRPAVFDFSGGNHISRTRSSSAGTVARQGTSHPVPIKAGDIVEVTIVEDPKGKGRLFAKYEPLNLVGPVLDQANIIKDRTVGSGLRLCVHSVNLNQKQIQFKPIDEPKKK